MPLRKQKVSVLISQGVQTKIDHKVLPSESLTLLENGEFSKVGRIEKRKGFTKVTKTTSGLINYQDDLISRNVSNNTDDDGTQASVYSEGVSDFLGNKGWSSGINYSSMSVSGGSSLYQKNAQTAVSDDGRYALVTFLSFDMHHTTYDQDAMTVRIVKKCSLVDRSNMSIMVMDMEIGATTADDGSCRTRPIWAKDKFYIIAEDGGDIRLWCLDPSENPVRLKDNAGNLASSTNGDLLFSNTSATGGTEDYPLEISASFPYQGSEASFDICTSVDKNWINIVRTKESAGPVYELNYSKIHLTPSVPVIYDKFDIAGVPSSTPFERPLALHRSQFPDPGGVAKPLFCAYLQNTNNKVIRFRNTSNAVDVDLISLDGAGNYQNKYIFIDNPNPTEGSGGDGDVDWYISKVGPQLITNTVCFPNICHNASSYPSPPQRDISGSAVALFGFSHEANGTSVKGPATLGFYQEVSTDSGSYTPSPTAFSAVLSPLGIGTTDLSTSVIVRGRYVTGDQRPRERDYFSANSFERAFQEESMKVAEPGWYQPDTGTKTILIPGKSVAVPIVMNFNNHFGDIIPSSNITLFDIRSEDYNSKCKPSSAMLQNTLYVADNGLYSYDGNKFDVHGILARPRVQTTAYSGGGATGSLTITDGDELYYYRSVYEWEDALGNLHQSEASASSSGLHPGAKRSVQAKGVAGFFNSEYLSTLSSTEQPEIYKSLRCSFYRTRANGTLFNLVSSISVFQKDHLIGIKDNQSDADATTGRYLYTDTGELANTPPPSPSVYVIAHKNRLFTIGKDKNIYFSKLGVRGFGLGFNPALVVSVPNALSDPPTALGSMDGVLYIFTEKSVYYMLGDGPDNIGQGDFYEPQRLPSPVGASYLSPVRLIDDGLLFTCEQGIFLIDRNQKIAEIGAAAEDLLGSNKVLDIKVDPNKQVVYFQTSSSDPELITYNYGMKQWGRDVIQGASRIDSIEINKDRLVVSTGTQLYFADSSYTDSDVYVPLKIKTAWIKLENFQSYQRVYNFQVLGESLEAHKLVVHVRYDYDSAMAPDVYEFTSSSAGKLQFKGHLSKQKCQSIQFEIFDESVAPGDNQGCYISLIELEIGYKADQYKNGFMKIPSQSTIGES